MYAIRNTEKVVLNKYPAHKYYKIRKNNFVQLMMFVTASYSSRDHDAELSPSCFSFDAREKQLLGVIRLKKGFFSSLTFKFSFFITALLTRYRMEIHI